MELITLSSFLTLSRSSELHQIWLKEAYRPECSISMMYCVQTLLGGQALLHLCLICLDSSQPSLCLFCFFSLSSSLDTCTFASTSAPLPLRSQLVSFWLPRLCSNCTLHLTSLTFWKFLEGSLSCSKGLAGTAPGLADLFKQLNSGFKQQSAPG